MKKDNVFFSIVVATRNRPKLLQRALLSLAKQTTNGLFEFEIILVDDGSSDGSLTQMLHFIETLNATIVLKKLEQRKLGHGPSFARNEGIALSNGIFICFLDDDDEWTSSTHLLGAYIALKEKENVSCLFLSMQTAIKKDGKAAKNIIWNEDLVDRLSLPEGVSEVTSAQLLQSNGFSHLNTLIASKTLLIKIDGFDESLRYEEDRHLFMRLIDISQCILFNSQVVAKHYIPDDHKNENASTAITKMDKLIQQLNSQFKLSSLCKSEPVLKKAKDHLCDTLKRCHDIQKRQNNIRSATLYASMAASIKFDIRWLLYAQYLKLKSRM
jgi:hypothetical protein